MLIIFGGLPGVGKTAIARELARKLGAVYVRIDSIEQAIRNSGTGSQPLNDTWVSCRETPFTPKDG
jgi:predicted kinase